MRCSRLNRSRKLRRKRHKVFIPLISIIPISAALYLSLITTPSYALMTSQVKVNTGKVTTAFVFPRTVQDMANEVRHNTDSALEQVLGQQDLVNALANVNSQQRASLLQQIQQLSGTAQSLLDEAVVVSSRLEQFAIRAQTDVNRSLAQLQQTPAGNKAQLLDAQTNLQSAQRVNAYVQAAYMQAKSAIDKYKLHAPLLSFNGIDLHPTVSQAVYGPSQSVSQVVYGPSQSVSQVVYGPSQSVSQVVYGPSQSVSQSVYGTSISQSETVTQTTYGKQDYSTLNLNETKLEKSPLSQSSSVPQAPPVSTPDKMLDNTSANSRTNRKTGNSNGISITLVPKD